ncbi:MAG: hypothetical protein ACK54C_16140 [Betaproteobacteria bacterium]
MQSLDGVEDGHPINAVLCEVALHAICIGAGVEEHGERAVLVGGLLQLTLLASYVLNRVALTVVRGKNEDYAFTVFESLNTTGEPLTAFETFKPRVVSAEGIARFEASTSREHLQAVSNYLSGFAVGEPLQAATRDLLIYFASAETGWKLSKRLADQRRYMKDEFERHARTEEARVAFVQHLRDLSAFVQHAWTGTPTLPGLPVDATTDVVKLCLTFLQKLNHSVTIAPLTRFYSAALMADSEARPTAIANLEAALKALTAFSTLWRASRRGTENIDQEYRDIMSGGAAGSTAGRPLTGLPPLARTLREGAPADTSAPSVDVVRLKAELRARLAHSDHGAIADKTRFIAEASQVPAYANSRLVSRMLLLAAHHDAVEDESAPGLIRLGRELVSPCFTYEGLTDERRLALEHIAPVTKASGWVEEFYSSKEVVHRIGNLVLVS